uniref:non-specific serine/threonine protein kinase n=1 Tax=Penaeus penicillatus TaxID=161924 RepID=A0A1L7H9K2_PENPN|nr:interleukin-1 receptor-associated kinase-1 [Penaeus penicillatus]
MAPWHKTNQEVKYIYDLPYTERKLLCNILDVNNVWEKLGGRHMRYPWSDLDEFRRAERCGESPTNRMLQAWGQQNHTVADLFTCLSQMEHFQAMNLVMLCIPAKYHVFFDDAETRLTEMFVEDRPTTKVVMRSLEASLNTRQSPNGIMHAQAQLSSTPPSAAIDGHSIRQEPILDRALPVQQQQQARLDSRISALGACALSGLSHKYSLDNLFDLANSRISHHPRSPKVPGTLLIPKPSAPTGMRTMVPTLQQRVTYMDAFSEKKINNDEGLAISGEVSCDDNNHLSLPKAYDFDQEYTERVERKLGSGKDELRTVTNNGMPVHPRRKEESLSLASSPGQASSLPSPPSPFHHVHAAESNQYESLRRISCTSDTATSDCIVPVIPYKELEEATAVLNTDNLLGRGGFGIVFRGTWKNTVAIKRIDPHGNAALDSIVLHVTQSLDELKRLQSYRHDNILQVYGYSADHDRSLCLVYQFMPNGSVEDRLQCRRIGGSTNQGALTWRQRYRIASGTARALQFLHTVKDKPLIHGDVKSANILLDQNYEAKLGDFGLAREGKSQVTSMKVSRVHGTKPYLPGDYLRSKKLSVKVDTYSYGIVLFELCTGLRAYDQKREEGKFLIELVVDTANEVTLRDRNARPRLLGEVFTLLKLEGDCVEVISTIRPDLTTVFKVLDSSCQVIGSIAQARIISLGETSSGTTPYMLQVFLDTAGSTHSSSVSPSTPHHQPSPASTVPTYPSPSSPSLSLPLPPVPGSAQHYPQHPLVFPIDPMRANGGVPYLPTKYPLAAPPELNAGRVAGTMYARPPCLPLHRVHINLSPPMHDAQDPPSYSETTFLPAGAVGASVFPLLPQASGLDLNSAYSSASSEDPVSDQGIPESSVIRNTTHNPIAAETGYAGAAAALVRLSVVLQTALATNYSGATITQFFSELDIEQTQPYTLSYSSLNVPFPVAIKSYSPC